LQQKKPKRRNKSNKNLQHRVCAEVEINGNHKKKDAVFRQASSKYCLSKIIYIYIFILGPLFTVIDSLILILASFFMHLEYMRLLQPVAACLPTEHHLNKAVARYFVFHLSTTTITHFFAAVLLVRFFSVLDLTGTTAQHFCESSLGFWHRVTLDPETRKKSQRRVYPLPLV
jgi:hypothetical protein